VSVRRSRSRLNPAAAGKTYPEAGFEVTAEAIEAYARATNDLNEHYLSGRDAVASPVWPVVPAFEFLTLAVADPELGVEPRRLLHLREEHVLRAPIRAGDTLLSTGVLSDVDAASGTFGVTVVERNQDGVEVAEVRATMLVRGAGRPAPIVPGELPVAASHEARVRVDPDQTWRYAEASGDHNPIHLDRAAARRAGLRGIILHGMCTMAMATAGAVNGLAEGDPTRIERVAVSFARPVVPGQELATRFWPEPHDGPAAAFGFATLDERGAFVLTNARALVRPGRAFTGR
jgi:acyl dehydratase